MKKEISHDEKIEFYHKYNDKDFQKSLQQTEEKFSKIGFIFLEIFLALAIVGGFITPWLWLAMIPAILLPVTTMTISHAKNKKKIDNLTENMTYKEFVNMFDNGEWKEIVKELNDEIPQPQKDNHDKISLIKELKNHDCAYVDNDKAFHSDHDDLML